jgi:hypothetical protein
MPEVGWPFADRSAIVNAGIQFWEWQQRCVKYFINKKIKEYTKYKFSLPVFSAPDRK